MELAEVWKQYLSNWPRGLNRKGVVVTDDEQIVFVAFLMGDTVVMFERQAPDSVGGRKVILPYSQIKAVKITEPVGDQPFVDAGFAPSLSTSSRPAPKTIDGSQRAASKPPAPRPTPARPTKA